MILKKEKPIVIAEVGVNHNGSISKAKKLIEHASRCGADVVKFQYYKTELLVSKSHYIKNSDYNPKKVFNMLKKYELNFNQFKELKKYAKRKKIIFTATPFDKLSVRELDKLNVPFFKLASSDINNFPLIEEILKKKKHLIFSTGRSSIKEIEKTINFLKRKKFKKFSILYCVSSYPTQLEELNLNAIKYFKSKFKCKVGFSDHTSGVEASIAAVAIGADYIEKHLTLNKSEKGPDHKSSIEPTELSKMIKIIRQLQLKKQFKKEPTKNELKTKIKATRSLFAFKNILRGTKVKNVDIISLRPAIGIKPEYFKKIIGRKVKKNIKKGDLIKLSSLV